MLKQKILGSAFLVCSLGVAMFSVPAYVLPSQQDQEEQIPVPGIGEGSDQLDWDMCEEDADCGEGGICDDGFCFYYDDKGCYEDADCATGGTCFEGACYYDDPECFEDADCGEDGFCTEEGLCDSIAHPDQSEQQPVQQSI